MRQGIKSFTTIELLIVVAIIIILAAVTIPVYGNLQTSTQLKENTNLLIQDIRKVKDWSMARVNDYNHGIKLFSNSYVLYQGSSYDTRIQAYDRLKELNNVISLSWDLIGSGELDEINFSKSFGEPDMTGTINIIHSSGESEIININSYGKIEKE